MSCKRAITLAVLVLGISGRVVSGVPLEYRIEGVAEYREGPDTGLDGAQISIVLGIDSAAVPFYLEDEAARYRFTEAAVALTIAGSVASDGTYPGTGEFYLGLYNRDAFMYDLLSISPNLDGSEAPFTIPGTDVYAFGIRLVDEITAQALDGVAVPTSIDLESWPTREGWLRIMVGEESVKGYDLVDFTISITEIPEPGTLSLLALGVAIRLRRRR